MGSQSLDNTVIKSPSDKRTYRILHLSNGLTALLVHDPEIYPEGAGPQGSPPGSVDGSGEESDDYYGSDDCDDDGSDDCDEDGDLEDEVDSGAEDDDDGGELEGVKKKVKGGLSPTKKAAAAMCVGMGSFSDPQNAQGLAHFLEHMLFMGSDKFPDENEYDSFLSKHGGSSNAFTETEYTCYHFDVNCEFLKGALKRFSQFFISPLVKAEAMEREIQSIDSEFKQVLQNDTCRLQQLQCHTAVPGHPFNRFCWGNKKSLMNAMENGIDLRERILQLYRENYVGGIMKLVVIGGEPLDILEEWVEELFSDVKMGHSCKTATEQNTQIWRVGKLYRLEAVKDIDRLELTWTLPCLRKEYLKKPEDYLSHLLGHESRGSLLFFLKSKGWATSLSAGVGDGGMNSSSVAYAFVMNIYLTTSGVEMIHDVIGIVYQYIYLLHQSAPQEWIFKELHDIGNLEFRFAEQQPQDDYAVNLAENFFFYSEEHIIYGEYAYEQWDPELIKYVLSFFTPENMRVDLVQKSFLKESLAVQYEPWFGSQYTEEDISESLLKQWANPLAIDPSLHFPMRNEFIPSDFSLRSVCASKRFSSTDVPKCILEKPFIKLWHKIDSIFNLPRANTYFFICLRDGYNSLKNAVLVEVFSRLLSDELNDTLYKARVAKLITTLFVAIDKLELRISGFSDKLAILLSKVLSLSKSFLPKADRFKLIKENMERGFRNTNMKPLDHSTYLRLQVLRETFWDVDDKLSCLVQISLSDLEVFIPSIFSQLHVEGLCHGNLLEEEAMGMATIFADMFPVGSLPMESRHQERILQIPSGRCLIRSVQAKNVQEENSVVELYFQIEQDIGAEAIKLRAITDLFSSIIEEPCFDRLRTKEQLGYVVNCGPRMTNRVVGFCFRVQSSNHTPLYLHERVNNFISSLEDLLDQLDEESFRSHRSGLIEQKLEKDPSLVDETSRHWDQIAERRYSFHMYKEEAEMLKTIQKWDIIDWYLMYLRPQSPKCRQLAVYVWGCNAKFQEESESQGRYGEVIHDLASFKSSSQYYPSIEYTQCQ